MVELTVHTFTHHCLADGTCHCDWRVTLQNCVEQKAMTGVYYGNIALSALVFVIGMCIHLHSCAYLFTYVHLTYRCRLAYSSYWIQRTSILRSFIIQRMSSAQADWLYAWVAYDFQLALVFNGCIYPLYNSNYLPCCLLWSPPTDKRYSHHGCCPRHGLPHVYVFSICTRSTNIVGINCDISFIFLVLFEFPWQFGYGAFALYLIGIAQTLADVSIIEWEKIETCGKVTYQCVH